MVKRIIFKPGEKEDTDCIPKRIKAENAAVWDGDEWMAERINEWAKCPPRNLKEILNWANMIPEKPEEIIRAYTGEYIQTEFLDGARRDVVPYVIKPKSLEMGLFSGRIYDLSGPGSFDGAISPDWVRFNKVYDGKSMKGIPIHYEGRSENGVYTGEWAFKSNPSDRTLKGTFTLELTEIILEKH